MIQHPSRNTQEYQVALGHAVVHVRGDSAEAAIRAARRELAIEFPRMWETIQSVDVQQFRVLPNP